MKRFCSMLVAGGLVVFTLGEVASAAILYVDKNNTSPEEPYDTPARAATDIQTAIDYASAGATVMVYAATYDVGETPFLSGSNRVYISKALTVRSVSNDPTDTIIKGTWHAGTTNGATAVRCVYMVGGASLIGFTLTNGATVTVGDHRSNCAGGVYAASPTAVISNCIIVGNAAYGDSGNGVGGGGVWGGTLYDCVIRGNRVGPGRVRGGGTFRSILHRCLVAENMGGEGAGVFGGEVHDSIVSNNVAAVSSGTAVGGGLYGISIWPCFAYRSVIVTNTAGNGGGAGSSTTLTDCLVKWNVASGNGGGAWGATVIESVIVSNRALHGGGVYGGSVTNSILAFNHGTSTGGGVARSFSVLNSLIYGNQGYGGGVYLANGSRLENSTITGNGHSGILMEVSGSSYVINSIVYSNDPTRPNSLDYPPGATIHFTNSCTYPQRTSWDAGSITNNPRFVAFGSGFGTSHVPGNYRLSSSSPCLGAGLIQSWMAAAVDLDGNPRIDQVTGQVDMGAYERVYTGTTIMVR